jgi:hypothetical protein
MFTITGLLAQTPVPVDTPTLKSVMIGGRLYCGLQPVAQPGQYQLYCYTTMVTPWDTLIENQVAALPQIGMVASPQGDSMLWLIGTNKLVQVSVNSQTSFTFQF